MSLNNDSNMLAWDDERNITAGNTVRVVERAFSDIFVSTLMALSPAENISTSSLLKVTF